MSECEKEGKTIDMEIGCVIQGGSQGFNTEPSLT